MEIMEYPKEFVDKVKAEFPNLEELHRALDRGNISVGAYLEASRRFWMSPEEIVRAFNEGRSRELKNTAEKVIRCKKLFSEWWRLARTQLYNSTAHYGSSL